MRSVLAQEPLCRSAPAPRHAEERCCAEDSERRVHADLVDHHGVTGPSMQTSNILLRG